MVRSCIDHPKGQKGQVAFIDSEYPVWYCLFISWISFKGDCGNAMKKQEEWTHYLTQINTQASIGFGIALIAFGIIIAVLLFYLKFF